MPIKVLDRRGNGYVSDTVAGINWAVANGADVINMSLGSSYYSSTEAAAVLNAYSSGVFVAAASGNAGGILQETFERRSWGYYFFQGRSMATPHVAAAAALLMAEGASNVEAEDALTSAAVDLGSSGWDSSHGWGLIQPAAALDALGGSTDADGFDDTVDCDDGDDTVYPGAPETCGDGIDQDCDGADQACASGPVISGVSDSTSRSDRTVCWSTDVPTTGQVCNDHGDCASTALGTSHSGTIHKRGSFVTITATEGGGDSSTYSYAL